MYLYVRIFSFAIRSFLFSYLFDISSMYCTILSFSILCRLILFKCLSLTFNDYLYALTNICDFRILHFAIS